MSEVHARPVAPRGRGSSRGRGGFSTRGGRGGRGGHATNGEKADNTPSTSIEDDSEVGQLKKKYGSDVDTIKEFFPGWTDEDAVMALEETDGNLQLTMEQIATGAITQWGEVSKNKKDKSKPKAKEVTTATSALTDVANNRNSRGGRGAFDSSRGGRGRGSERGGRGGARGGRGAPAAHTNGTRVNENQSAPAPISDAWETAQPDNTESKGDDWEFADATPVTEAEPSTVSSIIPEGVKRSWASIVQEDRKPPRESKKAPVVEKQAEETKPIEPIEPIETPAAEPTPAIEEHVPESLSEPAGEVTPVATPTYEPEPNITPSKDALTETNLEQVLDTSAPAPSATAASTAASSWDPRNASASNSYSALPQQTARTPVSGFAATALKATSAGSRSASFQRRVLDQEEAVRMPGNREVDRTTVQFGAFNLNGSGDEDIDGDREEPETRAQPPSHSPVAPRASLPPAPQPQIPVPESQASPLTHTRLPVAQPTSAPGLPSPQGLPNIQNQAQQGPSNQAYGQYGQYGSAGVQQEQPNQKYEPFAQQTPASQSPFEGHPGQQAQSQAPPQQTQPAFTSAPGEYQPYYASEQQRNNYHNYYGAPYGQHSGGVSQQEGAPGLQQRTSSAFNGTQNEAASQYPQSTAQQSQSRYTTAGEPHTSGHSTPNPVTQAQQQQPSQIAPAQSQHQPQGQSGNYQYSHPSAYMQSPYYAAYMNQQYQHYGGQGYGQQGGGWGGPYGGKGGVYNQPHAGYGMSPQTTYDHTSAPAAGGFAQSSLHGRESAVGGGLENYGRTASGQSSTPQALGGSGAFGMHDNAFARNSSYQGQGQNQHYGQQPSQSSVGDELKPFGDSKAANGPSPSLSQANRPTSAANNGLGQSTLPPPQASQQGYGGYPSHLNPQHSLHGSQNNSQYGHQAATGQGHQGSTYSQYPGFGAGGGGGAGAGAGYYGNARGGWGGNYGHN